MIAGPRNKAKPIFIIAEAGVNHNGSIKIAKKLIDVAARASADAVKFQTFQADKIISKYAPKAEYQKMSTAETESQLEMVKKLELTEGGHRQLIAYCQSQKIQFLPAIKNRRVRLLPEWSVTFSTCQPFSGRTAS